MKTAPANTRGILLTFPLPDVSVSQDVPRGRRMAFIAPCHVPFLPLGLAFWGATKDTYVNEVRIGNMSAAKASSDRIPARFFETGLSFEELARLAEQGELEGYLHDRQCLMMQEAYVGNTVRVEVEGPFETFVMWGRTYIDGFDNMSRVSIVSEDGHFRGTLYQSRLAGEFKRFEVTAPSEAEVSKIMAAEVSNKGF